jgi:hypothetical protein
LTASISTPWPPLLGDRKERRGASPLCTPRWVARAKRSLPVMRRHCKSPRARQRWTAPLLSFPRRRESRTQVLCQRVLFNPQAPILGGEKERNRGTPSDSRQEFLLHFFSPSRGGWRIRGHPNPSRDEPLTLLGQTTPIVMGPGNGASPRCTPRDENADSRFNRPPIPGGPRFVVAVGVGVGYECRAGREKRNPRTADSTDHRCSEGHALSWPWESAFESRERAFRRQGVQDMPGLGPPAAGNAHAEAHERQVFCGMGVGAK